MADITKPLQIFFYTGATVLLSAAAYKSKIRTLYRLNTAGTGWGTFSPASTFNAVTSLEAGNFYFMDAATLPITIDGATLTMESGQLPGNTLPTANAGSDIIITLPTNQIGLVGAGSDAEGPVSYAWTQIIGPNNATGIPATTANVLVSGLVEGTYQFRLTVKDSANATKTDDVLLTVRPVPVTEDTLAPSSGDEILILWGQSNTTSLARMSDLFDPTHQLFDMTPSLTRAFARVKVMSKDNQLANLQARVNDKAEPVVEASSYYNYFGPLIAYADTFERQNSTGTLYCTTMTAPGTSSEAWLPTAPGSPNLYTQLKARSLDLKAAVLAAGKPWKPKMHVGQAESGGELPSWKPNMQTIMAQLQADGILLADSPCSMSVIASVTTAPAVQNLATARQNILDFIAGDSRFGKIETLYYDKDDQHHYGSFSQWYHTAHNIWNTLHGLITPTAYIAPPQSYTAVCGVDKAGNGATVTRYRQAVSVESMDDSILKGRARAQTAALAALVCSTSPTTPVLAERLDRTGVVDTFNFWVLDESTPQSIYYTGLGLRLASAAVGRPLTDTFESNGTTYLKIRCPKAPNVGKLLVKVDGVELCIIDQAATGEVELSAVLFESGIFPAGTHTITFEVWPDDPKPVFFDCYEVYSIPS